MLQGWRYRGEVPAGHWTGSEQVQMHVVCLGLATPIGTIVLLLLPPPPPPQTPAGGQGFLKW